MTEQLLTVDQVAKLVQLRPEAVRLAIRRGALAASRPSGGRGPLRILPSDFAAWVASSRVEKPEVEPLMRKPLPSARPASSVTDVMRKHRSSRAA